MANLNAILKNKMGLSAEQAKKSKVLASLSGSYRQNMKSIHYTQLVSNITVVGDREVYKFGCYSFSWILTHFRLIKSIKVYKETESILNQDENDGDNESKKKE